MSFVSIKGSEHGSMIYEINGGESWAWTVGFNYSAEGFATHNEAMQDAERTFAR